MLAEYIAKNGDDFFIHGPCHPTYAGRRLPFRSRFLFPHLSAMRFVYRYLFCTEANIPVLSDWIT